ncbi:type III-B CRISPR module RAMP protein Cmr1 [Leucothrix arctica]|uniref:Type III-B CRISPR module RAMP protein Cmr1 n=1 Tax=Leucothrix arctica TaxID=1481894 RepID=A0A317CSB2_9GAMM|nr:type III-B CRISPR module RAMP protein Cmr1 [Leucothrix arctica]PWQ99330.1 type III-B CRISPR module RAMP protein Cmr1 [Leucothrix arctica]
MSLNFKEPHIIRATYRIVTPMFIGDANQNTTDGVRPPSVKGALRFWWRALSWGKFQGMSASEALKALNLEEARLFGAAMNAEKVTGGQGVFLLSIQQDIASQQKVYDWPPEKKPEHGASFMAYGLLGEGDDDHRGAIIEGTEFSLKLVFNPKRMVDGDVAEIEKTLEAWSLFGGLGGRSRRGMGSVTQISLNGENTLLTKASYQDRVEALLGDYSEVSTSPYTAFSKDSVHRTVDSNRKAREALTKTGSRYKEFRSTLKGQSFAKAGFGLPLKEFGDEKQRRASPLIFHVHELENESFTTAMIYLPSSQFHFDEKYSGIKIDKVAEFARGSAV